MSSEMLVRAFIGTLFFLAVFCGWAGEEKSYSPPDLGRIDELGRKAGEL